MEEILKEIKAIKEELKTQGRMLEDMIMRLDESEHKAILAKKNADAELEGLINSAIENPLISGNPVLKSIFSHAIRAKGGKEYDS